MECPFVPYKPATEVRPWDIMLKAPSAVALLKTATLGNEDADQFAALLVHISQSCGEWVSFPVHHAPSEASIVPAMILAELLEEKRDGDRWFYSLTPKAIEHLYESQRKYVPPQPQPHQSSWISRILQVVVGSRFQS